VGIGRAIGREENSLTVRQPTVTLCQARRMTSETDSEIDSDRLSFVCPRCGTDVTERLYGPCGGCRTELRATLGTEGHELVDGGYDPKMNVTPNAVAVKE
jgi:hypothetical protein